MEIDGGKGNDTLIGTDRNDVLSGGTGNDTLDGGDGNDLLMGGQGNDLLDGGNGNDLLMGGQGDDLLDGGNGNDLLLGGQGNDLLDGGNGNDLLLGEQGNDQLFGRNGTDYLDGGAGNDLLDGGAGNDYVFGNSGDDILLYSMSGNLGRGFANLGTRDSYDGGSGSDTLALALTYGELRLASVQRDIAAYRAFLVANAASRCDSSAEFHFSSFDLTARSFEALQIVRLVNTGPSAHADAATTSEDTPFILEASALLANDTDPDHLDVLCLAGVDATSKLGAALVLNADGSISYDPTHAMALQELAPSESAADSFSYTITDLGGATSTATVWITVTGVNDAPVAENDQVTTDEDTALKNGNVLANDHDVDRGDTMVVSAVLGDPSNVGKTITLDSGAQLTLNADGSYLYDPHGNFDYLPNGESATDSFTYVVTDKYGASSHTAQVSVKIDGVNDAPVAADDAAITDEDTALAGNVLGNDHDVDRGDTISVTMVDGHAHSFGKKVTLDSGALLTVNADGSYLYDPNGNFDYLQLGQSAIDSFGYTAADIAGATSTATVHITVTGVNDTPIAADDSATTDEDTTFILAASDLLGNDTDPDHLDVLSLAGVDAASKLGAALVLTADGSISYDPTHALALQELAPHESATDSFSYTITDLAGATSSATVEITVTGVNDAPVALDDFNATDEDTAVGGNVFTNDHDVDHGDKIVVSAVFGESSNVGNTITLGSGALLTLNADGSYLYDPNGKFEHLAINQSATDSFTYVVTDKYGASSHTAEVSIKIDGVNDAPVAQDDVITGTGSGTTPINVAVLGAPASVMGRLILGNTYIDAAAQLTDSTSFDIHASAINVNTLGFTSEEQWARFFADYDVVVLGGGGGSSNVYAGVAPLLFPALHDFVDAGGGIVTTGLFARDLPKLTDPNVKVDADYITPITVAGHPAGTATANTTITVSDSAHPIANGIQSYTDGGSQHELADADAGATILAQVSGIDQAAIAYDEVGDGRTVYLGALHMAVPSFHPETTRAGAEDTIFEQAVVWAAGDRDATGAATDENTVLRTKIADLLANDADVDDGDVLHIASVSEKSKLGAEVWLDNEGNVVYDPRGALSLKAGEIATDNYHYTVADGHGGFDTAEVSLTVKGLPDVDLIA